MSTLAMTRTLVEKDGKGFLEFNVVEESIPEESSLEDEQVLVAIEAAPINPSDIARLFAPAEAGSHGFEGIVSSVDANGRVTTALPVEQGKFEKAKASHGIATKSGNEGAGRVIAAGKGERAQSLKGKMVAVIGVGGSYKQHAVASVKACIEHEEGTTAEEAASSFVNPLTSLKMTHTMRDEGHTAIVHTAAGSQLGQMLVKICLADGIPLVNIVRRQEQVDLLKSIGAQHVVRTSSETYEKDLVDACVATGATIAFDATGGGTLGFEILRAMETAIVRASSGGLNSYGSSTLKKLYVYGGLNAAEPLQIRPFAGIGFFFQIQGFLLQGIGSEDDRKRVAREIKTTFSTTYGTRISLEQMMDPATIVAFSKSASNSKALLTPQVVAGK